MDRNHDGVVTIDEFLDCCRCDQAITNSMLVFDSTIWPSGNKLDDNRRNFTSSFSSQKAQGEPRVPLNEHRRQQCGATSSDSEKLGVHSATKHYVNGSSKSKMCENLSTSFGVNSNPNGSTTQQQQQFSHLHHPTFDVIGNKTKNNVGHNSSQMKRIQLSSAAKRCKSTNRSNDINNNNSEVINLDDICKADDVADGVKASVADDNCVTVINTPNQHLNIDIEANTNQSISTQSMESPTLVKVKTWYTESTVVLPLSQDEIFWYWTFYFFPFWRHQKLLLDSF